MFTNIVIGTPLVPVWTLLAQDEQDFEQSEKVNTLFTNDRFLPSLLVKAGIVQSNSEVRRNQPQLVRTLTSPDCFWVKWGKKRVFVVVGT